MFVTGCSARASCSTHAKPRPTASSLEALIARLISAALVLRAEGGGGLLARIEAVLLISTHLTLLLPKRAHCARAVRAVIMLICYAVLFYRHAVCNHVWVQGGYAVLCYAVLYYATLCLRLRSGSGRCGYKGYVSCSRVANVLTERWTCACAHSLYLRIFVRGTCAHHVDAHGFTMSSGCIHEERTIVHHQVHAAHLSSASASCKCAAL